MAAAGLPRYLGSVPSRREHAAATDAGAEQDQINPNPTLDQVRCLWRLKFCAFGAVRRDTSATKRRDTAPCA